MKPQILKKHALLIMVWAIIAAFAISCNKDDSEETAPANIEKPEKIEIILHEGHLHGPLFHSNVQKKRKPHKSGSEDDFFTFGRKMGAN